MSKTATITLSDEAYRQLRARVGDDEISGYIEELVRPHGYSQEELEAGYRAMAADQTREREAREWMEAVPNDRRAQGTKN